MLSKNDVKPFGYVLTGGSATLIAIRLMGFEITGSGLAICVIIGMLSFTFLVGLLMVLLKPESVEKIILAMAEWRKAGQNVTKASRGRPDSLPK